MTVSSHAPKQSRKLHTCVCTSVRGTGGDFDALWPAGMGRSVQRGQVRLWVDCRPTRPAADRQPNLWLWFSEKVLRRPAAFRRIADAHADSVIGS